MKRVLLVGCGAEIGAMLLVMNDPTKDGFVIDAILTRVIAGDAYNPNLRPIDSLYARIVLAQPDMLDAVSIDYAKDQLIVRGRPVKVYWGNSEDFDLRLLGDRFNACILATSKKQINTPEVINRFLEISDWVGGVAEADTIPALYANLIGTPEALLQNPMRSLGDNRIVCFGSCQSNGWHASLRAVLELAQARFTSFEMQRMEIDIIHPDTPTGRLGTKSIEARSQDPRNNFRPSFSQIAKSMSLLFPGSCNSQTVSLRTLIMPPGYQICRFFFSYQSKDERITREDVVQSFDLAATRFPDTLRMAHLPLGSRGFEAVEASAVALAGPAYLQFYDDPFVQSPAAGLPISELVVQAYVHNVRGYCRSVLNNVKYLLTHPAPKGFFRTNV